MPSRLQMQVGIDDGEIRPFGRANSSANFLLQSAIKKKRIRKNGSFGLQFTCNTPPVFENRLTAVGLSCLTDQDLAGTLQSMSHRHTTFTHPPSIPLHASIFTSRFAHRDFVRTVILSSYFAFHVSNMLQSSMESGSVSFTIRSIRAVCLLAPSLTGLITSR